MDGGRICPVCGRRAGTKPEPDAAESRASAWARRVVDALLSDREIELAATLDARAAVVRDVMNALVVAVDEGEPDDAALSAVAKRLLGRWDDADVVADIFTDADGIARVLVNTR